MSAPKRTFLFTDVQGSTQLFEMHPLAYPRGVARHHEILRDAFAGRRGEVFETIGDAAYAAFPDAGNAVGASVDAQKALQAESWGLLPPIRVRMGLHTGTAELRGGRYYGPAVQRCERIMSAGHGGQVLLSSTTADEIANLGLDGVRLRDLGAHRLRGLVTPEHVFQLTGPDLRVDFPALKTLTPFLSRLPQTNGRYVEPDSARSAIKRLLSSSRLVTIVGAPGVGKTRLALEVVTDVLDAFPDGIWFVAVADAPETKLTVPVARVLGLEADAPLASLAEQLASKQILLILDGCDERLLEFARLSDELLRHSRHVRILATSRETLGITGESTYRLRPLATPARERSARPSLAEVTATEAARLFLDRALTINPGFAVTDVDAARLAELIAKLDGLPRSIEEAASQVLYRSIDQIIEATSMPADDGLRALGPAEQLLLERVSVFNDLWTLEAAELVGSGNDLARADVLDLLTGLVEKSVVTAHSLSDGSVKYSISERLRNYGRRRLAERGELEEVQVKMPVGEPAGESAT